MYISIVCGKASGLINQCNIALSSVRGLSRVGGIVGEGNIIFNCGVWNLSLTCSYIFFGNVNTKEMDLDNVRTCEYFGGIAGRCQVLASCEVIHINCVEPGYVFGRLAEKVDIDVYSCACKEVSMLYYELHGFIILINKVKGFFPYSLDVVYYDPYNTELKGLVKKIVGNGANIRVYNEKNCFISHLGKMIP